MKNEPRSFGETLIVQVTKQEQEHVSKRYKTERKE